MKRIRCLAIASMTLLTATIVSPRTSAQATGEAGEGGAKVEKLAFDLDYIPPSAVAAVCLNPRSVLLSPSFELYPIEVVSAYGKQQVGVDPVDIDQIMAIGEAPSDAGYQYGAVVRFAKPLGKETIPTMLAPLTTDATIGGKPYRKGMSPMIPSIFRVDDKTLIIASDDFLKKMLDNHAASKPGKLTQMLGHVGKPDVVAVVLVEPLRPLIGMSMAAVPDSPPFGGAKKIPDLIQYIAAKIDFGDDMSTSMALSLRANDEDAAGQLEAILNGVMALGQEMALGQVAQQAASKDPVEQATAKYMKRVTKKMFELLKPVRKGDMVTISGKSEVNVATMGVLAGLALPALQAARGTARGTTSMNNLKELSIAALNYESTYGKLPPRAFFDKQGKPLLSWRVAVLPFIEQNGLYRQFHLDEPWDSPHNKALIAMMPKTFASPTGAGAPGTTPYLAVTGKGLMFDGDKGRKPQEILDGTSFTIMFVEASPDKQVVWTKPDDWEYDEKNPMAGLGSTPQGFIAAFADGSVQMIPKTMDPKNFKGLLTIAGGERVTR